MFGSGIWPPSCQPPSSALRSFGLTAIHNSTNPFSHAELGGMLEAAPFLTSLTLSWNISIATLETKLPIAIILVIGREFEVDSR